MRGKARSPGEQVPFLAAVIPACLRWFDVFAEFILQPSGAWESRFTNAEDTMTMRNMMAKEMRPWSSIDRRSSLWYRITARASL